MRAREPDCSGFVEREGVRVAYEVFGDGEPTILLLPAWSIVHSRAWKGQVPFLARHFRVVTFDVRGNGRSDRPSGPEAYTDDEIVADAVAVLDATGTERAVAVGLSLGGWWGPLLAADHPDRVSGLLCIGAFCPLMPLGPKFEQSAVFTEKLDTDEGWAKLNAHYWRRDYPGWVEFFFSRIVNEPHSTKLREDTVGWGLETTPEVLIDTMLGANPRREQAKEVYDRVRCPSLVVHGTGDELFPHEAGVALSEALGAPLVTFEGAGHTPPARHPVAFNLLLRDFVESVESWRPKSFTWTHAPRRRRRALYLSSPIGLGHALRDVAIADELRRLRPDVEVDWLTQHPVTAVLEARGERVHPASAHLASESGHFESESAEHDLHCFQAWRRMDEILLANFHVFHDLVTEQAYDLWVGDEAWDVDFFLHDNPELKRAEYVWLTDFVGWLPMPDGGPGEAALTADYNAEMLEQIARYPRLRDRSIFVGNADDVVPDRFGPDLPAIRGWTEEHYDFSGYVTGFDPGQLADRDALRAELGYHPDERVCLVTVGGSAVGRDLLRRVVAAYPAAKQAMPGLRMVVVTGPRIDPASLPAVGGLDVRGFVPGLYRHLAACDLAVVQGGLTTTMELTASRRPFLYFPLAHHFEQNFHVRHRLDRYRAGRCMDYATATPEVIAEAIAAEMGRQVDYRPVETDGATRAAARIAELL